MHGIRRYLLDLILILLQVQQGRHFSGVLAGEHSSEQEQKPTNIHKYFLVIFLQKIINN